MLRLAKTEDLSLIKSMYLEVIADMQINNIAIWDDYYPIELLANDITLQQLFVYDDNGIVSCFALCKEDEGDGHIIWPHDVSYIYLTRFVVSKSSQNLGVGSKVMMALNDYCKSNNYQSIKALVVDYNLPALKFYHRNGFEKGQGIFHLVEDGVHYDEFGLQKLIK